MALDPLTSAKTKYGITIDSPPYRQQRILYPSIVWLLTFGSAALIPAALIAINLIGAGALGWLGGALARTAGRHAFWGLAIPLHAGFLITLQRDLSEIVEICLVLAAILYTCRDRQILAAILLSMAVLTKETALLVAAGTLLSCGVAVWRRARRPKLALFYLPVITYLVCQACLRYRWEMSSNSDFEKNLGYPFAGFFTFFKQTASLADHMQRAWFIELCLISGFTAAVSYAWRRTSVMQPVKLSWLLYLLLIYSLSNAVWVDDYSFLRAISEFYVLGVLVLLRDRGKLSRAVLAACCFLLTNVGEGPSLDAVNEGLFVAASLVNTRANRLSDEQV